MPVAVCRCGAPGGFAGIRVGEASHPGPGCPGCGADLEETRPRWRWRCYICAGSTQPSGPGMACSGCAVRICLECADPHQQQPQQEQRQPLQEQQEQEEAIPVQPPVAVMDGPDGRSPAARHRSCPQCTMDIRGGQATRRDEHAMLSCAGCRHRFVQREWLYRCSACAVAICKQCRREQQSHGPGDPEPSAGRAAGNADGSAEDPLLEALRRLPVAWPRPPMLWAPRRFRSQCGAVLRETLADAVVLAGAPEGCLDAERAHLLARNASQLLLRPPPRPPPSQREHSEGYESQLGPAAGAVVRDRLKHLRCGDWLALAVEALDELQVEKACGVARPSPRANGAWDEDGNLLPAAAQAATLRARTNGLRSAEAALVGLPPVPPGPDTDAKVIALFETGMRSAEEEQRFQEALTAARAIPERRRLRVTYRLIASRMRGLNAGASPGGSGTRNSHIQLVYSQGDGPATLLGWCACFAQGHLTPWLARMWTGALARPFWKTEAQEAVRPVLCGEAYTKFAMGVCVAGAGMQVNAAVGDRQFGCGRAGGAELEVGQVRAAAAVRPDWALVSADLKNAFGRVRWADALLAAAASVPRLAVPLATCWAIGCIDMWLQSEDGWGWRCVVVVGSLVQGNLEGHPTFCIVLAVVLIRFSGRLPVDVRKVLYHWEYVDDIVWQVPLAYVRVVITVFEACAQEANFVLQRSKTFFHVPAYAHMEVEQWPQEARSLVTEGICAADVDGIALLGTEGAGCLDVDLYNDGQARAAVQRRDKAVRLIGAAGALRSAAPPAGSDQAAWQLVRQVACRALDFDGRILPCSSVLPLALTMDEHVLAFLAAALGGAPDATELVQLQSPTRFAGMASCCPLQRSRSHVQLP